MKTKLALLVSLFALPFLASAQGTINFSNPLTGRVYDASSFGPPTLLNNANYRVGLYFNLDTNTVSSGSFSGSLLAVTNMSGVIAGRFIGGNIAGPGVPPGGYIAAQIRVWYGNFPSYEAMIAAGVYDEVGNCIDGLCDPRGRSLPFLIGPFNGSTVTLNNLTDFAITIAPIPEPSPLALAGLAALAWLWMRRMRGAAR